KERVLAAHKRRVADKHAGNGTAETVLAQLYRLPHAGTNYEVDIRCRRLPGRDSTDEPVLPWQHSAKAATPRRKCYARGRTWRERQKNSRMVGQRQSKPAVHMGLFAQNTAAADRQIDSSHHYRVRPAESVDSAARRCPRSRRQRLVLRLRSDVSR